MTGHHPSTQHLLDLFDYEHLPEHLKVVSRAANLFAHETAENLSSGPELTTGLRKLLEAKDCFVRQAVIDARTASAVVVNTPELSDEPRPSDLPGGTHPGS